MNNKIKEYIKNLYNIVDEIKYSQGCHKFSKVRIINEKSIDEKIDYYIHNKREVQ